MTDESLDLLTHDMAFDGINQSIVSGKAQVIQNLKIRLLLIQGEWFLNSQAGMPYFEKILVKNPDLSAIDLILKATIMETPEITGIVAYQSTINKAARKLTVSFTATSQYGDITLNNLEL